MLYLRGVAVTHLGLVLLAVGLLAGSGLTYSTISALSPSRTVTSTSTLTVNQTTTQTQTATQFGTETNTQTITRTSTQTQTATQAVTSTVSQTVTQTSMLLVASLATFVLSVERGAASPYRATDQSGNVRFSGPDAGSVLQQAIDATSGLGGGTVAISVGRYNTSSSIILDKNVAMAGVLPGPFDGVNPASHDLAPEFLITNSAKPFITLNDNTAVEDSLFYYPSQVLPSASAPMVYPPTLHVVGAGVKITGCTFVNSYDAILVEAGRVYLENLAIGAFHVGITLDHVLDFVHVDHVTDSIFWDTFLGINEPSQAIDAWVNAHGIGLAIYRADGPTISDYTLYTVGTGILIADSPDTTLAIRNSYGVAANLDMEGVRDGINVTSVRYPGWTFTNLQIGCNVNCITVKTSSQPNGQFWFNATSKVLLSVRGGYFWYPDDECPVCANKITPVIISGFFIANIQDVTGYNPVGPLSAPPVPASGVALTNLFPVQVRIAVSGGAVSEIRIDGTKIGITAGMIELEPGETITLSYTSPPSWTWSGF